MYLGERINFSINTSFYKRSDCIDHIYEGLKAQTYKYWEWVVTDDFSEDKNAEKSLKEIARNDHRVVYYTQSRKKELFWNPNYGASGNVIFQMDSDDTMYPNILEIYAKHFMEDPSLMGICCGCYMEGDDKTYRGYGFNFLSGENCLNMTWGRAWRNIIPHFDYEGKLQHFQNDTNIIRSYPKFNSHNLDNFSSGRLNDWKLILTKNNNIIYGNGVMGDRYLINQSASNLIIYAYASSGLFGVILIIYIYLNTIKSSISIMIRADRHYLKDYNIISSFCLFVLMLRSLLETSYGIFGIDLILYCFFMTIITFDNKE